jgi:hypothetical protein
MATTRATSQLYSVGLQEGHKLGKMVQPPMYDISTFGSEAVSAVRSSE